MNNTQQQGQQQAAPAVTPSQAPMTSAQGSTIEAGAQAQPQQQAPQQARQASKTPGSGMAGSFQQYQKANQGTAQNRLGQAVQSGLQKNVGAAQGAMQRGQTNFQQLMDKGSLQNRDTAVQDVTRAATAARGLVAPTQTPAPSVMQDGVRNTAEPADPNAPAVNRATSQPYVYTGNEIAKGSTVAAPSIKEPLAPTPAPVPSQPTSLDEELKQRFADIINARYKGPESLRETGAYDETLNRVNKAQDLATMAKTAGGREDLLAQLYGRDGSQYTRGMSRLDAALLNTNADALQGVQTQAKQLGGMRDQLSRSNVDSMLSARNRSAEIADIRQKGRDEFSSQRTAEEKLTDDRIAQAQQQGKDFVNYFRDTVGQGQGTTNLNLLEAALLGVNSGEGIYNMGSDFIKEKQLEKEALVSKDEFARQNALAQLAQLDQSRELRQNSLFTDADKAGTQAAIDALDVEGIRSGLNAEEQAFRDAAQDANISGSGKGKASKGNMFGKKTKTANSTIRNNVGRMLEAAGYDMDSEIGQNAARSILSDEQATSRFLTGANTSRDVSADGTLQGAATGAASGASIGSAGGAVGAAIGAGAGAQLGAYMGSGTMDPYQQQEDVLRSLGLAPIADSMRAGRDIAATGVDAAYDYSKITPAGALLNKIPGMSGLASNVSSAIRGIDTKGLAKKAKAKADTAARKDLLKNYQNYLTGQGFSNRLNVSANDPASLARLSALQNILGGMDKTNVNTRKKEQG